jgi:hypothetical protein
MLVEKQVNAHDMKKPQKNIMKSEVFLRHVRGGKRRGVYRHDDENESFDKESSEIEGLSSKRKEWRRKEGKMFFQ